MKLLDLINAPRAIQPDNLLEIRSIYDRHLAGEKIDIEAVESRLGRPLQNTRAVTMRGATAIIPVTGPVFRYANLFTEISGATSLAVLATDFAAADNNPAVGQIVMVFDTPGGQANGIAEMAQMIRAATKPVIAYIDNVAASAGYWLASAASQIVMAKTAVVGSIGAVISIDTRKADGQVEIVSSQSPNKRADVTTDSGRAQIQALIDGLAQVFVEDVAAYRGVSADTVLTDFGGGGMVLAAEAVARGMADKIGTLETLLAELAGQTPTIKGPTMTQGLIASAAVAALTEAALLADNPTLHAQLLAKGASAERQRILDVEAQSLPGHEALIARLKADGTSTGGDAAMQVLAAERAKLASMAQQLHADAPPAVPHAQAPAASEETPQGDTRLALHQKAKRYQADHPGTDYQAAIAAVSAQ